jgi:hypothetical protein
VVRVPSYRSRYLEFDYRRYQIFWEVVGLERGPFSLVSTIEELLGRNSNGSGLENWEYGRGDPLRWPRGALYSQKLAQTSPTCCGRSVGIVRLRAVCSPVALQDWSLVVMHRTAHDQYIDYFMTRNGTHIYQTHIIPWRPCYATRKSI